MDHEIGILMLLAGIGFLSLAWPCWTGLWSGWADKPPPGPYPRAWPITLLPALGFMGIAPGVMLPIAFVPSPPLWFLPFALLSIAAGIGFGLAVLAFGFVLPIWDPEWFGPRWYRRVKRAFAREEQRGALAWMADDPLHDGESTHDATQRHLAGRRPAPPFQVAQLVSAPGGRLAARVGGKGTIDYYPHALVLVLDGPSFAPEHLDDPDSLNQAPPVNAIIPGDTIHDVCPVTGDTLPDGFPVESLWPWLPLRVDTAEGTWVFETRRPKAMADEIHRRYIDDTADMYGVRLPKSAATRRARKAAA